MNDHAAQRCAAQRRPLHTAVDEHAATASGRGRGAAGVLDAGRAQPAGGAAQRHRRGLGAGGRADAAARGGRHAAGERIAVASARRARHARCGARGVGAGAGRVRRFATPPGGRHAGRRAGRGRIDPVGSAGAPAGAAGTPPGAARRRFVGRAHGLAARRHAAPGLRAPAVQQRRAARTTRRREQFPTRVLARLFGFGAAGML